MSSLLVIIIIIIIINNKRLSWKYNRFIVIYSYSHAAYLTLTILPQNALWSSHKLGHKTISSAIDIALCRPDISACAIFSQNTCIALKTLWCDSTIKHAGEVSVK